MSTKLTSKNLKISPYISEFQLNPRKVFYESLTASNASTTQLSWNIRSPDPDSLLHPQVFLSAKLRFTKAADHHADDRVAIKEGMPFMNCMSNVTLTVNGASISVEPANWGRIMQWLCVGANDMKRLGSTSGGGYDEMPELNGTNTVDGTGAYNPLNIWANCPNRVERLVKTMAGSLDVLGTSTASVVAADGITRVAARMIDIDIEEPLIVPPFNPFCYMRQPAWSWWGKGTKGIPHFNTAQLTINLDKVAANMLQVIASDNGNDRDYTFTGFQGDVKLFLRWSTPPENFPVPAEIALNTFNVSTYRETMAVGDVVVGTKTTAAPNYPYGALKVVNPRYMRLDQVPDLITIHCRPVLGAAVNATVSGVNAPNAPLAGISEVEFTINTASGILSTTVGERQLYQLTLENAGMYNDFPFTFKQWRNGRSFVALQPEQLGDFFMSPGVIYPTNLKVKFKVSSRVSTDAIEHEYFINLWYGKHYLTLNANRAEYAYQSTSRSVAQSILFGAQRMLGNAPTGGEGPYTKRVM